MLGAEPRRCWGRPCGGQAPAMLPTLRGPTICWSRRRRSMSPRWRQHRVPSRRRVPRATGADPHMSAFGALYLASASAPPASARVDCVPAAWFRQRFSASPGMRQRRHQRLGMRVEAQGWTEQDQGWRQYGCSRCGFCRHVYMKSGDNLTDRENRLAKRGGVLNGLQRGTHRVGNMLIKKPV